MESIVGQRHGTEYRQDKVPELQRNWEVRAHAVKSANVSRSSRLTTMLFGLMSRCKMRCLCSLFSASICAIVNEYGIIPR